MSISFSEFGKLKDGRTARMCTLVNRNGMTLVVTDFGCRILKLLTKDKNGQLGDVVQGHRTLEEYFGRNYHGAFIGRYANRIGNAQFTLNGKTYQMDKNDGRNTLHGGVGGYHQVLWEMTAVENDGEPSVIFTHVSPDGDEGYPGELKMTVTYTVKNDDSLELKYDAVCDQATPFNPTNHAFFNLSGDYQKKILDTTLAIYASKITNVSDDLIPDGTFREVAGTPYDFTQGKKLGQDMFADDHMIRHCGGFDHNFCVDGEGFRKIAEAHEPDSGRLMEVWSDMPGVQLYTFNDAEGQIDKNGVPLTPHTSFCMETQYYPDSPNHPNFPFKWLQPGEPFSTRTVYRFSVK